MYAREYRVGRGIRDLAADATADVHFGVDAGFGGPGCDGHRFGFGEARLVVVELGYEVQVVIFVGHGELHAVFATSQARDCVFAGRARGRAASAGPKRADLDARERGFRRRFGHLPADAATRFHFGVDPAGGRAGRHGHGRRFREACLVVVELGDVVEGVVFEFHREFNLVFSADQTADRVVPFRIGGCATLEGVFALTRAHLDARYRSFRRGVGDRAANLSVGVQFGVDHTRRRAGRDGHQFGFREAHLPVVELAGIDTRRRFE